MSSYFRINLLVTSDNTVHDFKLVTSDNTVHDFKLVTSDNTVHDFKLVTSDNTVCSVLALIYLLLNY